MLRTRVILAGIAVFFSWLAYLCLQYATIHDPNAESTFMSVLIIVVGMLAFCVVPNAINLFIQSFFSFSWSENGRLVLHKNWYWNKVLYYSPVAEKQTDLCSLFWGHIMFQLLLNVYIVLVLLNIFFFWPISSGSLILLGFTIALTMAIWLFDKYNIKVLAFLDKFLGGGKFFCVLVPVLLILGIGAYSTVIDYANEHGVSILMALLYTMGSFVLWVGGWLVCSAIFIFVMEFITKLKDKESDKPFFRLYRMFYRAIIDKNCPLVEITDKEQKTDTP